MCKDQPALGSQQLELELDDDGGGQGGETDRQQSNGRVDRWSTERRLPVIGKFKRSRLPERKGAETKIGRQVFELALSRQPEPRYIQSNYHKKTSALVPGVFEVEAGSMALRSFVTPNPDESQDRDRQRGGLESSYSYFGPAVRTRTSRMTAPTESNSPPDLLADSLERSRRTGQPGAPYRPRHRIRSTTFETTTARRSSRTGRRCRCRARTRRIQPGPG